MSDTSTPGERLDQLIGELRVKADELRGALEEFGSEARDDFATMLDGLSDKVDEVQAEWDERRNASVTTPTSDVTGCRKRPSGPNCMSRSRIESALFSLLVAQRRCSPAQQLSNAATNEGRHPAGDGARRYTSHDARWDAASCAHATSGAVPEAETAASRVGTRCRSAGRRCVPAQCCAVGWRHSGSPACTRHLVVLAAPARPLMAGLGHPSMEH